jgi:hypothetical protein
VLNPGSGSPNRLAYVAPPTTDTVPGVPAAVTVATDVNVAQATISWQPPVSNGGTPITGYRVSRDGTDSTGAGPWSVVVPATSRSQAFSGLKTGSTYQLSVQAITAVGTGAAASGTVTMTPIAPGVPKVVANKDDAAKTATITWAAPTATGGLPITGYRVSRDGTDSTGAGPWSAVVPATARSQIFPALKPGATYTLSVQAINAAGTGARPPNAPLTTGIVARTVDFGAVGGDRRRIAPPALPEIDYR